MGIEKYIAIASLGLFIMFVGEIITIFNFMMIEEAYTIEPEPKILQFISIGLAPAIIMVSIAFIMAKRYGSKQIGAMIFAGGIILFVGMGIAFTMMDDIDPKYELQNIILLPPLFMGISIPVMVLGMILFKIKKNRRKKESF